MEGLRKLLDDGKGQKRRGKEEDSGITGSIYSEDLAVFLKKTGEEQGNSQNRYSIELISVHSVLY